MAEVTTETTLQEVKGYQYFQPELIEIIASENIYEEDSPGGRPPWEIVDTDKPYLKHVKSFSTSWRHLRLLADFMQVGTTPLRWKEFLKNGKWNGADVNNRENRVSRTNVTRLDYCLDSNRPIRDNYTKSTELRAALTKQALEELPTPRRFRLFIVEDLSRDVIEMLGAHYDIEPTFFRDQIFDYAWYNTRDRWMDPPRLNIVSKRQRWLQIRFATSRYFEDPTTFKDGCEQFEGFNVFRRPEDDLNNTGFWDAEGAIVGLSRTRSSFWLGSAESHMEGAVGILLVDPTIKAGSQLWRGYRNWQETPSMRDLGGRMPPQGPPRKSFFEDLIYWLEKPDVFGPSFTTNPSANVHIPIQALLYMICGEWLTIAEYIQTRLAQVEWEISFPEHFLKSGKRIEVSLQKLHIWRRLVPLYHEMLTETLERVFKFPCHPMSIGNRSEVFQDDNPHAVSVTSSNDAAISRDHCQCPLHQPSSNHLGPINALREDFARLRISMETFQKRIDRLTSVVTASISIDDSHRGLQDTRNVTRLTWLATCFIPLSLTATIFCMQSDIESLRHIIGWYFLTALLLVCFTIGVAFILTGAAMRHHFGDLIKRKEKAL